MVKNEGAKKNSKVINKEIKNLILGIFLFLNKTKSKFLSKWKTKNIFRSKSIRK
jgi:hypothetical protein